MNPFGGLKWYGHPGGTTTYRPTSALSDKNKLLVVVVHRVPAMGCHAQAVPDVLQVLRVQLLFLIGAWFPAIVESEPKVARVLRAQVQGLLDRHTSEGYGLIAFCVRPPRRQSVQVRLLRLGADEPSSATQFLIGVERLRHHPIGILQRRRKTRLPQAY